ncbi:MAG: restriction endonuclease subunit S [Cyanobacteria bacterium HKST-UBA01]|nr:restriction endonuclease subunit S [Cyanobacteria bacterium HKST-UBA01]
MSYPIKQLSQLCDIAIGRTPARKEPKYWGKGNKWVSISDLSSKVVCDTREEITDYAVNQTRCRVVPKGTLLFSFKLTIGKMAFSGCDLYTNEAIAALHIKDKKEIDGGYLFFALQVAKLLGSNQAVMGKTLNSKSLAQIEIPVPEEIDDQKRIAQLLGKVEGLIARRKKHLQQLDDLLKSVFLEMFGDPVRNEKGWEKEPFSKLLVDIESGKSPKCEARQAEKDEWGVLKLGAVTSCIYKQEENKALPQDVNPVTKHEVKAGDLLFSRKNTYELVAACAYVFETRPKLLLPDLIFRFVLREDAGVNPIFLWKLLVADSQRKKIQSLAAGAAGSMPNISKANLKQVLLPVPPIPLQNQYATIVEMVEGLKARYQQSLTDLESLYAALSQKAFKGELDLSRVPLPAEGLEIADEEATDIEEQQPMEPLLELPAPEDLAVLQTAEGRTLLLEKWLNAWLEQLGDAPFSAQAFMDAARQRVSELAEDEAPDWGVAEYDELKTWVFDALEQGRLTQGYDDANNRVQITAVKG